MADEATPQWSLESLTKAYQQGYMAGLTGQARNRQPYPDEIPAAAWEAGWDALDTRPERVVSRPGFVRRRS